MIVLLLTVVRLHLIGGDHLLLNHGLLGRRSVRVCLLTCTLLDVLLLLLRLLLGLGAYYEVGPILLTRLLRQLLLVWALARQLLIEACLVLVAGDVVDELLRIWTAHR